jgi:hypothetical protein
VFGLQGKDNSWNDRQLQDIIGATAHWCGRFKLHLGNVGFSPNPNESKAD